MDLFNKKQGSTESRFLFEKQGSAEGGFLFEKQGSTEGRFLFQKITAKKIIAYQQKLADDLKLSPSTIKRRLSSIRKFCEWAAKQGYLQENPFIQPLDNELPIRDRRHESLSLPTNNPKNIISKAYKAYHNLPATKYLNYGILIIFCAALGFGAYDQFFKKAPAPLAYSDTLNRPNRYLSFQGRLTDSSDNPISSATNITFKLWKLVSGGTEGTCIGDTGEDCLWNSQTCVVTPDQDGIFSIMLGTTSGPGYTCASALEIGEDVFTKNQNVWLGITVDTDDEMDPRIQVATVGYALNAETLQGMPPGTGINSIPYINNAGDIVIAAASPSIQGTSGTFAIEGQTGVTIQAGTGVGGNITISPKGDNGIINLTSEATTGNLLNNQSGASFGTVGGKEEDNLYYGYAGTDSTNLNLLKLESGSTPIAKFTINAAGDASAAGILKALTTGSYFTGDVTVSGGDITGANSVSLDIGEADANYITSSVGLAVGGAQNYYINSSGTGNLNALTLASDLTIDTNDLFVDTSENKIGLGTTNLTERLTVSGNATLSGTLALGPQTLTYAGVCNQSSAGKMYYDGDANKYYFCNGTEWTEMGSGAGGGGGDSYWSLTGNNLYPISLNYNVGIGTSTPTNKLSVIGNADITGNVGIGTTTPTAKLEVVGNALLGVGLSGAEDALTINTDAGFSGNLLKLAVNNTEKFSIDATGMLTTASGIFTSTVADGASAIGFKLVTPEYVNPGAKLFSVFNNTDEKFSIDQSGTGTFYGDGTGSLIDNTSGDITIDAASNNISLAGNYLINVGRIGIGRTVPNAELDIAGDATISGTLSLAPQVQAYAGVCNATLAGKMYYDGDNNKYYFCNGTSWTEMGSGAGGGGDSWWSEGYGALYPVNTTLDLLVGGDSTASANVKFGANSNTDSFIMGNMGIGTTNPNYKLDIAGINQLFSIGNGGWADKVYGSFNDRAYIGYDGDSFATFQGGDGKGIKLNVNNDTFGSGTALTVDNLGNVGIGTAAPDSLFSVGASSQFKVNSSGDLTTSGTITAATNETINGIDINAGTISDATWNGTAIGTQYGGTGQDWSAVAQGSIPYFSGAGTMSTLAPNTAGYVLQTNGAGANPTWVDISSTAGPWTLIGNNIFPDTMIYNVGIGTSDPNGKLHVAGTSDDEQLILTEYSGQTKPSFVLQNSDGTPGIEMRAGGTGLANTFIGVNVGSSNTTGEENVFIGNNAGTNNTEGSANTFIGIGAGEQNTTGVFNTFIGAGAGSNNLTGIGNVFLGGGAGGYITTGSVNTFLGFYAGANNQEGVGNVFIGYNAGGNETGSDKLYIDNSDTTTPLIWGDFNTNILNVNGSLGIGTTDPTAKLQVIGTTILGNGLTGSEDALLVNTGAAFSGNLLKLSVNGTQKLAIDSTGQLITASGSFLSTVADSGSAIAYNFDTLISLTAPGAKLLSIKNAGDEKMSLDKDGVLALYNSESKIYNSSGDITIDAASGNVSFATNNLINIGDLTLGGIASMSGTPNLTLIPTANLAKIYLLNGGDLGLYSSVGGDTGVGQILKISNNGEATISGTLSLAPQVQAFAGTCNASSAGKMYYDAGENKYYYCNGSSWASIGTNYWTLIGNNLYPNSTDYNLGIGTTDPNSYKLYVVGNMAAARFVDTANSNYFVDPAAAGTSATFYGNVGIGTTSPSSKLDVTGDINFTGKLLEDGVEVLGGVIAMWSGSVASIPSGWYLCDGTNGTPDLRNRFVVGAGDSYGVGSTGGEATHTLTIAEMPSHGHSLYYYPQNGAPPPDVSGVQAISGWSNTVGYEGSANARTATWINKLTAGNTGGDSAHENRPPYYALAYIMKKTGSDLAEWVPATGDAPPGTIMSIDSENSENVKASEKPYDTKVAGIIATSPDTIMGTQALGDVQMALSGRVPTKVSLINGEIKIGDPITTSPIPGFGMKATQNGPIVGKAMDTFNENSSIYDCLNPNTGEIEKCGSILAFVNVSWYNPETNINGNNNSFLISDPNYQFLRFKDEVSEGDLVNVEYQQITNEAKIASYLSKTSSQSKSFTGVISKTIDGTGELLKREFNGSEISNETRLVTNGNTKVKISPSSENIQIGDFLTLSDNPGRATKASKFGSTIGKALETWAPGSGKETIQVLVSSGWYDPDVYLTSTGDLHINSETQDVVNEATEENTSLVSRLTYRLLDTAGNQITKIGAFAEIVVANLKAGLIKTQELIAEKKVSSPLIETNVINTQRINLAEIQSSTENGDINLNLENKNGFGTLIIQGNSSISGTLSAQEIETKTLKAQDVYTEGNLNARSVYTEDLQARSATISGTLYAEDIMTKNGKFSDLINSTSSATYITQNITNVYQTATSSADETENETNISEIAVDEEASSSAVMSDEEINNLINEILASSPEVASQAALTENISINSQDVTGETQYNTLNIGGTMTLADNSLNSITGPLYLQNLGLGGIDLLAGKIIIDQQGNATFEENLTVKGTLAAKSINPLTENDLVIDLAQIPITENTSEANSDSSEISSGFGNLLIKGVDNEVVASIDASGSAHFNSLGIEADYSATQSGTIIAAYDNLQKNGEYSPALETNATAGMGILPIYEKEIIIYDNKISDESLIYITPLTDTNNKVIFIKAKKAYKAASIDENGQYLPEEKGWFKVSIDTPLEKEIQFNWWIVN